MACGFVRVMKGDEVVIERDFERKVVEGEVIARNADRRMRCLLDNILAGILSSYDRVNSHCCGLSEIDQYKALNS